MDCMIRKAIIQAIRVSAGLLLVCLSSSALPFRVVTWNVENYLDAPSGTRPAKSEAAKAKIRNTLVALHPDVLALQEIGSTNALLELQSSLKSAGLDLPNWEYVTGFDTNIHVAVLTKFEITARHPHTNDAYLLNGKRLSVSRGFAEVVIRVNTNYAFTLITAHLKSKRPVAVSDEADMRLEEAKLLREKIDDCFNTNPNINLVVLGDMNDTHDSPAVKTVIGRGKRALTDTRPCEQNGDSEPKETKRLAERTVAWTHFYAVEDTYSRIDYILLSKEMSQYWMRDGTFVLAQPNWGLASDHRPLVATFNAPDE